MCRFLVLTFSLDRLGGDLGTDSWVCNFLWVGIPKVQWTSFQSLKICTRLNGTDRETGAVSLLCFFWVVISSNVHHLPPALTPRILSQCDPLCKGHGKEMWEVWQLHCRLSMGRDIGDDLLPSLALLGAEGTLQWCQETVIANVRKLIVTYLWFSSSPYWNLNGKRRRTFIYIAHLL